MSFSPDQAVEVLRAVGEPTRLRVLSLLAGEELSVMELSRILDQSQPRVSRHLKLMADAGLIDRFPDGARVFYRLTADASARRAIASPIRPRPTMPSFRPFSDPVMVFVSAVQPPVRKARSPETISLRADRIRPSA